MGRHQGSCHCGAVKFEINVHIDEVIDCNCSICMKKGIVHIPVEDPGFSLLAGQPFLSTYRFGSGDASHWFCRQCGIHCFGRPRNDPSRYTVNARCLDDYLAVIGGLPVKHFDGRNHPKDRA